MSARKSALPAHVADMSPPGTEPPVSPKVKTSRGMHAQKPKSIPINTKSPFNPKTSRQSQSQKRTRNKESALRIRQDPRLKELMQVYDRMKKLDEGSEDCFNRLMAKRLVASGTQATVDMVHPKSAQEEEHVRPPAKSSSPNEKTQEGLPEIVDEVDDRPYIIRNKDAGDRVHEGRLAWEETFRTTLRRLLIDFDLSDEAKDKYQHLDRLHNWFLEQTPGRQKGQAAAPAPSYLSLEVPRGGFAGRWAKGSPRNVDTPLSDACVVLSQSFRMRKPAHLTQLADASRPRTACSFSSAF